MPPKRSSTLLLSERPLLIRPHQAVAVGLNEAVFIQQLHFWLSETDSGSEIEGRRWVYNTYDGWRKQFPFWSIATLRRIVTGLEKSGYVLSTEAFNDHPADRTKWYTIDYDALDALGDRLSESADHVIKMSSPPDQNEQNQLINMSSSLMESKKTTKKTSEIDPSMGPTIGDVDNWRVVDEALVTSFIQDFGRELGDEADVSASVRRTARLWAQSRVDRERFIAAMYEARKRTQRFSASIAKTRGDGAGKNKMAYFFGVLEDQLGLRETPS